LVTFEYDDGVELKTRSMVLTIKDKFDGLQAPTTVNNLTDAWGPNGAQARRADIRKPDNDFYDVRAILAVQGLSVQSRTAWIDNGRYTQAEAVGYRKLD
jgi:hypothetical protein